jgi:hypothetical protein
VISGIGVDETDEMKTPRAHEGESMSIGEFVGLDSEQVGVTGFTVIVSESSQAIQTLALVVETAVASGEESSLLHETARPAWVSRLERASPIEK